MEGDATQSWCRMRDCADRNQNVENVGSYKKMWAWRTQGLCWSEESRHFTNAWVLRRWAHLLHRATSDICGAVLDYDQAHFVNLSAIICYIILTFAFGMKGKLHQAKMHCQFPLNFCRIWWCYFNSLNRHWWKVEFAINLLPSIDIFLCWFLMDGVALWTQQGVISCLSRCNALYWTKRYAGNWKFEFIS
jgi:hypothetical protein